MAPLHADAVYTQLDVDQPALDGVRVRPRRDEVMRRAAASMRRLQEVMDFAVQHLAEGDADLADLIVPAR